MNDDFDKEFKFARNMAIATQILVIIIAIVSCLLVTGIIVAILKYLEVL